MVWTHYWSKKSLVVVVSGWQTKFSVSPSSGFWYLVLGPFGPDLGPDLGLDLDLTWDLDLNLSLTKIHCYSPVWWLNQILLVSRGFS